MHRKAVPQLIWRLVDTDHLNTPRVITNQAAQVVWRWDQTDPFGGNSPDENPSGLGAFTCNLRLPGQYFDKETNLHYNYFRDYDPGIGRYVQADPLGITTTKFPTATTAGLNHIYSYVGSNPIGLIDLFGLAAVGCTEGVGCYPTEVPPTDRIPPKAPAPGAPGKPGPKVLGEECVKQPVLEACIECCQFRNRFNPPVITLCITKFCTDPRGITQLRVPTVCPTS